MKEILWCLVILFMCFLQIGFSDLREYVPELQNPRLINLSPKQFKDISAMEKRLYGKEVKNQIPMDRIEKLEKDLGVLDKETLLSKRIENLKLASQKHALQGTSIPYTLKRNFKEKYIQQFEIQENDDVGLLDGLLRAWQPNLYEQLKTFRQIERNSRPSEFYYD